jgi:hypothetical protein
VVTVADLVIPDVLPFVDEIVLALLTLMFGLWKDRRGPTAPAAPGNLGK